MNKSFQQYQGDIPILQINEKFVKKINFKPLKKDLVVAEGEATGHRHIVKVAEPTKVLFGEDENGKYLKVLKGQAVIEHNTHQKQIIPQGIWFVGSQYEYDEVEALRRVQD